MYENEEILRLVYESGEECRELAFGSDNLVYAKIVLNGETTGWKFIGRWENFNRLEQIAFEKYNEGWIVAWNGKFKPEKWSADE